MTRLAKKSGVSLKTILTIPFEKIKGAAGFFTLSTFANYDVSLYYRLNYFVCQ
jgi:hypothetical protein